LVVITAAVFVAGRLQAVQRNQLRSQSRQARRLLLEQQEREHQVKLEERRQIARELHDVISHGVALMVVQAGAAEAMLASDPAQARRLLGAVQNTGERAANDLRRQLGLLGQDDDVMPAPRLADVRLLVADLQAGGLRVTLRTDGPLDNVEPSTGLAAYRIVQESLTNVIKHAPHAQVDVAVAVTADALDLVIVDNGGAPADSAPPPASGHGLVGMRERVELYGGHLAIAPDAAGFKVHARLPLEADTHAPVVEVTDDA
jgi:signal transduction histidine kinase